jgi:plasmid maintenance system antidote protein VapI
MAQLVAMIQERQGDKSTEAFANEIGMTGGALNHIYNGRRQLGMKNCRRLARHFPDDRQFIRALAAYLLDIDHDPSEPL